MPVLEQYRIIELGIGPVTGLAGMVFADFGADVIKVNPPSGDPFDSMPASRMWNRGKRTITVDLNNDDQRESLRKLILDTGDAVVTTLSQENRESFGFDAKSLRSVRPDLIVGVISGFGERGPYRHYPGYEGLVAAKSGRMLNFAGVADRSGPNYSALQVGVHATSQSVGAAVLAALDARERTGLGFTFETSLLRGMMPYEMGVIGMSQLQDKGLVPRPRVARDRTQSMPTLNYHPVKTKDGHWLQLGNLLPHLLDNFFRSSGLTQVFREERYQGDPMTWDREVLEEFRDALFDHMQTRTLDEWMQHFIEDGGVVAHPYQTTQDALTDPDVVANGHAVKVDGGVQLGLLANLVNTPGNIGVRATAVEMEHVFDRKVNRPNLATGSIKKPLDGITVVESATIIAAPLGAATLADMGARVIKIEPLSGDPFRGMMRALGASKCNTGKESICIDLKSSEGQRIAQSLAARADVWIHNYRIGVPEKLGIDYDTLASLNPQLVYVSANGYGPHGPGAKRPSTHPIPGAALGGVVWQIGGMPDSSQSADLNALRETSRKLLRANEVNPDPNTSMVVATTAVLGLCARRASGVGQKIYIDMFGANAYANWDDFLNFDGKPDRPSVDRDGFGLGPLYRLYECLDSWVFLAVVNDREKQALVSATGVDLQSPDLASKLASFFKRKSAIEWERELTPLGIGCVEASNSVPPEFFMQDEHVREENLLVPAVHPDWGDYFRLGPMAEFDRDASYPGTGAAGGATLSLLDELGYSEDAIQTLLNESVVHAA